MKVKAQWSVFADAQATDYNPHLFSIAMGALNAAGNFNRQRAMR